jgi:hypothetical protein
MPSPGDIVTPFKPPLSSLHRVLVTATALPGSISDSRLRHAVAWMQW